MQTLPTRIDPRSEAFRINYEGMLEQVRYLNEQLALARVAGGEDRRWRVVGLPGFPRARRAKMLLQRHKVELRHS
jgi:hypothetical protein